MTATEYESALKDALIELSESRAQAERLHIAMNLLSNRGIEDFATISTSNGCHHTFGIGVAVGVPLTKGQLADFRSYLSGQRTKEVVVVVWKSQWPALNIRQISVFSPENFRLEAEALRSTSEHNHAGEPNAIGVVELQELMEKVVPLLDGAEQHYRATRIRRASKGGDVPPATAM